MRFLVQHSGFKRSVFTEGLKSTSWEKEVETPCTSTVEQYGGARVHAFACVVFSVWV